MSEAAPISDGNNDADVSHEAGPIRGKSDKIDAIAQLVAGEPEADPAGSNPDTMSEPSDTLNKISELRSIGDLLNDDQDDEPAPDAPDPAAPRPLEVTGDLTPGSLSDALGIEPDKLYETMQITMGDGQTATLGELKDIAQGAADSAETYNQANADIERQQLEIQRERHVHQKGIEVLQQYFGPDAAAKLTGEVDAQAARERARLATVVPELGTDAGRSAYRTGAIGVLREHGFSTDNEALTALGSIKDHRLGWALHTLIKKAARFDAAMTQAAETRRETGKASSTGRSARKATVNNSPMDQARKIASRGRRGDKVAGVAHLLSG